VALLYLLSRHPVNSRSPVVTADPNDEALTRKTGKKQRPREAKLTKHHGARLATEDAARHHLQRSKQIVSGRV